MFYAVELLQRRGQFGIIWLAATTPNNINRREICSVSVPRSCDDIIRYIERQVPPSYRGLSRPRISLYLASKLMYGVTYIHKRQTDFVYSDVTAVTGDYKFSLKRTIDNLDVSKKRKVIDMQAPSKEEKLDEISWDKLDFSFSDFGIIPKPVDQPIPERNYYGDSPFECPHIVARERRFGISSSPEVGDVSQIEKRGVISPFRQTYSPIIQRHQSPPEAITMKEVDIGSPQTVSPDDHIAPMSMKEFAPAESAELQRIEPPEDTLPIPPIRIMPPPPARPPSEHGISSASTEPRVETTPSAEEQPTAIGSPREPGVEPSPPEPQFPPLELVNILDISPPPPRRRRPRRRYLLVDANIILPQDDLRENISNYEDTLITNPANYRQHIRQRMEELQNRPIIPPVLFRSMGRWDYRRGFYTELPIARTLRSRFLRHCNTRTAPLEDFPELQTIDQLFPLSGTESSLSPAPASPVIEDSPKRTKEPVAIPTTADLTDIEAVRQNETIDTIDRQESTVGEETEFSSRLERTQPGGPEGAQQIISPPRVETPVIVVPTEEEFFPELTPTLSLSAETYDPSVDDILDLITQTRRYLRENELLTFRILCPPATNTRKHAAILFGRLLELHAGRTVYLEQVPPHTFQTIRYSDIYIYDSFPS